MSPGRREGGPQVPDAFAAMLNENINVKMGGWYGRPATPR